MTAIPSKLVINPDADVAATLVDIIGQMGGVEATAAGFVLRVYHTGGFPWEEVFKALLYRDFKIEVKRHKADLYVEATSP